MIRYSISHINAKSPYKIELNHGDLDFTAEKGIRYSVSFIEDQPLGGCDTFQFAFRKRDNVRSAHDSKVQQTLLVIIEEFFAENKNVLLYICDTSDGREEKRNRLFIRWFEEFAVPNRFTLCTANATIEGEGFYAAIIVENDNPKLQAITQDFQRTAKELSK